MTGRPPCLRALRPRPSAGGGGGGIQQSKEFSKKNMEDEEEEEEEKYKEMSMEFKTKVKDFNKEKINENQRENQDYKEIEEEEEDGDEEEEDGTEDLTRANEVTSLTKNEKPSIIDTQETPVDVKVYLEQVKKENKQKIKTSNSVTRCPMCSYDAPSPRDLETHQRVHHLKRRFFRCAKCSYVTHVRARYTKHVKYHSMPMIKCDSCDFRTPYKWNLDRHTRNHGGGGAFQCRACNFTADIRQSLTVHETNHHEPPVGQNNRKTSTPFERKPRNSPKRYNQVGASDFRELSGAVTSVNLDSYSSDQSVEDRKNIYAGAECIALKCEEKACQFVTAWDSEMQRHLAECHAPPTPNKSRKPLPMLIPLSPVSIKPSSTPGSGNAGNTLLKVPRVRVRPELAQIARDTEMAKLYGNKEVTLKRSIGNATNSFERKNACFFDKLKEKLNTSSNGTVPEVAVSTISDLKCWCTYKASSMEELACHKQTHHTALSVSVTTLYCSKCKRRCKNPTDLEVHMQFCQRNVDIPTGSSFQKLLDYTRTAAYRSEYLPHVEWDMSLQGGHNSSGSSVEHQTWEDQNAEEQSVKDSDFSEPPSKLLIVSSKESSEDTAILRPPPLLRAAVKSRGQSVLKNNVINSHGSNASASTTATTVTTTITVEKQNLWKYKQDAYAESKSHSDAIDQNANNELNLFGCGDCPFSASDIASLTVHRMYHQPNKNAMFKCYLCPYYVTTKTELLDHARLHGEELAVVHQRSVDYRRSPISKCKVQMTSLHADDTEDAKDEIEELMPTTSKSNSTTGPDMSKSSLTPPPPLLLDTRALPDAPLVWVSRPDGTLTKMLKCRHCPYITSRRAEVRDHESMHTECVREDAAIACADCSFICTHREIMLSHAEMHSGSLGTVHCLVDQARSDSQQLSDLATLLGLDHQPVLGQEPDLKDLRLVYCCSKCPARFLCEKELRIHMRYHSTELAYTCQWCSYAARQSSHLLAHQKAHSTEYQERTKYLLTLYGHSQRYPPPATACVESNSQDFGDVTGNIAWIVVEMTEGSPPTVVSDTSNVTSTSTSSYDFNSSLGNSNNQRPTNQVFTCAKCPARYFKLDALEYHMTLHGSNNRFKCIECDYSSKTAQNLIKHQVVHRRQGKVLNISTSISQNSASMITPPPDPQFGVFMRGNPNFVYPGYLRNGRLKEKRYKCHKCPSAFEKREQYRIHLTLHGAKQRYRCNTCDYSVKYYANYIQHLKKHQANAEAQASRRRLEDDHISVDSDSLLESAQSNSRSGKTIRSNSSAGSTNTNANCMSGDSSNSASISNQDKQTLILMQRKGMLPANYDPEIETIRCQNCPFSTTDKEAMDSHKRRHGIERMTPSCPHCDYIPRRDENVGEHIRLHFTRLYKPESYLIVELLTLTMRKIAVNGKEERHKSNELLFKECSDGRFFPQTDGTSNSLNNFKEKVIVDPNTGETKQRVTTE